MIVFGHAEVPGGPTLSGLATHSFSESYGRRYCFVHVFRYTQGSKTNRALKQTPRIYKASTKEDTREPQTSRIHAKLSNFDITFEIRVRPQRKQDGEALGSVESTEISKNTNFSKISSPELWHDLFYS